MFSTDASRRSAISVQDLLCSSTAAEPSRPRLSPLLSSEPQPPSTPPPLQLSTFSLSQLTDITNTSSGSDTPPAQPPTSMLTHALPSTPPSNSQSSLPSAPSSPKKPTRGPWRLEEDRLLIDLVRRYGACHWSAIAAFLPRRSGKQARERWINQLNPALKKKNWTAKEDRVILHAHAALGNKWSAIAQMLPGRTDNSVKNRFNSTLKRAMRERARSVEAAARSAAAAAGVGVSAAAGARARGGSVCVNVDDVVESLHARPLGYRAAVGGMNGLAPEMISAGGMAHELERAGAGDERVGRVAEYQEAVSALGLPSCGDALRSVDRARHWGEAGLNGEQEEHRWRTAWPYVGECGRR